MKHSSFFAILLFALLFNSCKNDLKLNAPYKEVPSIYAVINPQEKIKIIRINKVFLGEGDANQMAKVADSVNYQPGELTVTLSRSVNGATVDACPTCPATSPDRHVITFRDSVIQTDPGAFNTTQRVYVTGADLHQGLPGNYDIFSQNTNPDWKIYGDYVLTVKNNKTGNVFTAKAAAIDSLKGNQGNAPFYPYFSSFNFGYPVGVPNSNFMDYSGQNNTYHIYYTPENSNAAVFQVIMRVHFYDQFPNGNKNFRYFDYTFNNQYPKDVVTIFGQKYIDAFFRGKDLFSVAGVALSKMNLSSDVAGRKLYKIQCFIYASSNDYIDYLQFAAPSLNISQNKPLYSNFDNKAALGIFTFRSRCSIYKEVANNFITEFQQNTNTCRYLFYNADESRKGCN